MDASGRVPASPMAGPNEGLRFEASLEGLRLEASLDFSRGMNASCGCGWSEDLSEVQRLQSVYCAEGTDPRGPEVWLQAASSVEGLLCLAHLDEVVRPPSWPLPPSQGPHMEAASWPSVEGLVGPLPDVATGSLLDEVAVAVH